VTGRGDRTEPDHPIERDEGTPPDHAEVDLGWVAAVSDVGRRHHRNEDSFAVAAEGGRAAVVVCDGVSSSANPDQASAAAATAAIETLKRALDDDVALSEVETVLREAVDAARVAVGEVPESEPGGYPAAPSTTIVAALVAPDRVVVASLGDSRAYLLAPTTGAGRRLTVDDSLAERAIAQGVPAETAYASPQAHVITGWLGGDADGDDADVTSQVLDGAGLLLVCSDGLWNYFETAEQLAQMAAEAGDAPIGIARRLAEAAIEAGGSDNITVAVATVGG
jgi:serine/threonine protein phosphatase PrpC